MWTSSAGAAGLMLGRRDRRLVQNPVEDDAGRRALKRQAAR